MRLRLDHAPSSGLNPAQERVLIVSNRLPFTARVDADTLQLQQSSGGVATGLRGVQEQWQAVWVGWSGLTEAEEQRHGLRRRLAVTGSVAVPLSEAEIDGFYRRYSNSVLWPALHGWSDHSPAESSDWATYRTVNERFADVVCAQMRPDDCVWIHDYHLMLLPALVRARLPRARIGFFLHTPFPQISTLASVRHCRELLEGMLGANVVGFHTPEYARNFLEAAGTTLRREVRDTQILSSGCKTRVCVEPMGIDAPGFERIAAEPQIAGEVSRLRGDSGAAVLLGVDRLDYTKGILQRLLAFERLLEIRPQLRGLVRMIQIAVPSREDLRAYRDLREHVERAVDRINLRFGSPGFLPIDYLFGSVDLNTLVALYRVADVMLVTPIRDGMNLVAKEFVASRADGDGVLVLSRFAGAAVELRSALLANPRCVNQLAEVYHSALTMPSAERHARMRRLRKTVASNDVFRWACRFMDRVRATDLTRPIAEFSYGAD
jgi:trehalose 6-phosphate synthase/phosphatase